MATHGECLCGSVKFEISGSLGEVRYCHCLRCRQATGTAFSANARIPEKQFKLLAGSEDLRSYEMGPGIHRFFCSKCGCPAFVKLDRDPDYIRPRIGGLSGSVDVDIAAHVWVGSKAEWHSITDDLHQFDQAKPRE
jgi:hypothetical protein